MAYFVVCTFDLKNGSRTDYENAYADLDKIGLRKAVVADDGTNVVAPTTTTVGTFNGQDTASVRTHVRDKARAAFAARGFKSEIFVVAANDWAWGGATT